MVSLVDFLFGFTAMVAFSTTMTGVIIGLFRATERFGWWFRRGSLAREAQRELAKARVRAQRSWHETAR